MPGIDALCGPYTTEIYFLTMLEDRRLSEDVGGADSF